MKLLPLAFYLLVFEPEGEKSIKPPSQSRSPLPPLKMCAIYPRTAPTDSRSSFRGFGTGLCTFCAASSWAPGLPTHGSGRGLKIAGTCGLLGAAITLHAIYNLLIAYGGAAQYIAYALPVLLVTVGSCPFSIDAEL